MVGPTINRYTGVRSASIRNRGRSHKPNCRVVPIARDSFSAPSRSAVTSRSPLLPRQVSFFQSGHNIVQCPLERSGNFHCDRHQCRGEFQGFSGAMVDPPEKVRRKSGFLTSRFPRAVAGREFFVVRLPLTRAGDKTISPFVHPVNVSLNSCEPLPHQMQQIAEAILW